MYLYVTFTECHVKMLWINRVPTNQYLMAGTNLSEPDLSPHGHRSFATTTHCMSGVLRVFKFKSVSDC